MAKAKAVQIGEGDPHMSALVNVLIFDKLNMWSSQEPPLPEGSWATGAVTATKPAVGELRVACTWTCTCFGFGSGSGFCPSQCSMSSDCLRPRTRMTPKARNAGKLLRKCIKACQFDTLPRRGHRRGHRFFRCTLDPQRLDMRWSSFSSSWPTASARVAPHHS